MNQSLVVSLFFFTVGHLSSIPGLCMTELTWQLTCLNESGSPVKQMCPKSEERADLNEKLQSGSCNITIKRMGKQYSYIIPAPCSPTTKITTTQQLMVTHIQKCTPDGERMVSTITHTEQCTPSRTCTATPPGPTGNARETGQDQAKEVDNCSALAGGLGTLAALMVLGLVGMAIGWAWSYHRRREKSNDQERVNTTLGIHVNPAYSTTITPTQPCLSVQYSSHSLQDTLTTHKDATQDYDIIVGDGEESHILEQDPPIGVEGEAQAYEVPCLSKNSAIPSIEQ